MTELELLQQGLAFHRAGRAADAAERYQQVLRANPSHPDALYLLAVLAHENQKSESAIELARRAIQVSGEQARLSEILGLALMTLARYDEAEPALVRATESGSPNRSTISACCAPNRDALRTPSLPSGERWSSGRATRNCIAISPSPSKA